MPTNSKNPLELQVVRKFNKKFVEAKLAEILQKPMHKIREIALDEELSGLDHWIAKIVIKGVIEGDHSRLNFMFDRLIGKVTEVKEIRAVQPFAIESYDGSKTITLGVNEISEGET